MNNTDLERAISQRQAKIEQLQKYVDELRETEHELTILLEARRIVGLNSSQFQAADTAHIQRSKRPYSRVGRALTKTSLAADAIRVLELSDQEDMSHHEIHRELERTRGPTSKRGLWSTLCRLVDEKRIQRPRPARYAAIRPEKTMTVNMPQNGMGDNHYEEETTQENGTGEALLFLKDPFTE